MRRYLVSWQPWHATSQYYPILLVLVWEYFGDALNEPPALWCSTREGFRAITKIRQYLIEVQLSSGSTFEMRTAKDFCLFVIVSGAMRSTKAHDRNHHQYFRCDRIPGSPKTKLRPVVAHGSSRRQVFACSGILKGTDAHCSHEHFGCLTQNDNCTSHNLTRHHEISVYQTVVNPVWAASSSHFDKDICEIISMFLGKSPMCKSMKTCKIDDCMDCITFARW